MAAALVGFGLLAPPVLGAQAPAELEGRLIERVTFQGLEELSEAALRPSLITRPTRCRGLLLRPFCWAADWEVFIEHRHLSLAELPRDELRLLVRFFRAGFRDAAVSSEIRERSEGVEVVFHVEEGPPTLIERFELSQIEEVLPRGDIRRAGLPGEGDRLDLDRLEDGIGELTEGLRNRGFLDGAVHDTVDVAEGSADVRVIVEPGARSTVRSVEVSGNEEVEAETIRRGLFLDEGEILTQPLTRRAVRTLHQSNLFYQADVTVPEQADSAKTVEIRVQEAPPRLTRIGGGLNTLDFAQLEGRFTHYNWRGGGRRLDLRASVGNLLAPQLTDRFIFMDILPGDLAGVDESPFEAPTWQVSAEFQQPHLRGSRNTLGLGAFAQRRMIPGISVDRGYGADVSLTRRLLPQLPLSLTYRYEVISIEAGDVFFCVTFGICDPPVVETLRGRRSLSPLSLDLHVDGADAALAPTEGYRVRIDFEHGSRFTLSDFRYNRVSAQASYYQPFGGPPRHVVSANLRVGWVGALEGTRQALGIREIGRELIHPRKRFFAGGARSVRGYPENQLGPAVLTIPREDLLAEDRCTQEEIADRSCDPALAPADAFFPRPLGGTAVLEGSVEYRIPVGTVTAAVFVDAGVVGGRLAELLQDATGAVTPGVGVRFDSSAGPIRIDVGYRPRLVRNLPVVTESETAPANGVIERELVQLEERRRFDPLEDQGTLGRILGRLTLHLSIGEAF
jgi:outer membrane protein assembly factor BamA